MDTTCAASYTTSGHSVSLWTLLDSDYGQGGCHMVLAQRNNIYTHVFLLPPPLWLVYDFLLHQELYPFLD